MAAVLALLLVECDCVLGCCAWCMKLLHAVLCLFVVESCMVVQVVVRAHVRRVQLLLDGFLP